MNYLEKRRRNQVKKQLRLHKPWLMGAQLNKEVDRVMGISDSGNMDWAAIKKIETSAFPTPESITVDNILAVSTGTGIRPYKLFWFFTKKINRLKSSGKTKHDYHAFLEEIALESVKKELSDDEKRLAVKMFADFQGVSITQNQIERMMLMGEL